MTQLIYLAGSLAGVAALVALSAWLFGVKLKAIDPDAVETLLKAERPGFRLGRVSIAVDGRSALVEDGHDGAIFIVVRQGDGLAPRRLDRPFLRRASQAGSALSLRFSDFTFPSARIDFADPAQARDWAARLAA
jgi:hypothetical protein